MLSSEAFVHSSLFVSTWHWILYYLWSHLHQRRRLVSLYSAIIPFERILWNTGNYSSWILNSIFCSHLHSPGCCWKKVSLFSNWKFNFSPLSLHTLSRVAIALWGRRYIKNGIYYLLLETSWARLGYIREDE
jgi:hypothetical protein